MNSITFYLFNIPQRSNYIKKLGRMHEQYSIEIENIHWLLSTFQQVFVMDCAALLASVLTSDWHIVELKMFVNIFCNITQCYHQNYKCYSHPSPASTCIIHLPHPKVCVSHSPPANMSIICPFLTSAHHVIQPTPLQGHQATNENILEEQS